MLELYQFQHSAFCLKVRMVLNAKDLSYKIVEIQPGIGQVDVFKISGQRQVPVLKDNENVISDSTAIIKYLETIRKTPEILPKDPKQELIANLVEDWADTTFAQAARIELIKAASIDSSLREALVPEDFPEALKGLVKKLPFELMNGLNQVLTQDKSNNLVTNLEKLSNFYAENSFLVGDCITIADIAIAAQLSLLRFPESSGKTLHGKGCPGFADNPNLEALFRWRDQLEKTIMGTDPARF